MSRRTMAVVALLSLVAVDTAWADWRGRYKAGVEAFAARRWADVVREMNAALAERTEERAGTSVLVRRYTPRYYLAAALAQQGDCRGALPVFREAAELGQIQRTDDYKDFQRRQRACETLLSRASNASAVAGTALEKAEQAAAEAARLSGDDVLGPLWEAGDPSLAELYDQAERQLRQARQQLSEGRRTDSIDALGAAQAGAEQAAVAFADLIAEANAQRAAVTSATASALESLEQEVARARRALRGVRDLAPYPRELGRRVGAVGRTVETIEDEKATASSSALESMTADLERARERLAVAARRPPKALLDAGEAFLAGRMTETLTILEGIESRDARVRGHSCLLAAAATFALAELAAPDSPAEQAQLDEAVAACRALEADALPTADPSVFSPRFVDFFQRAVSTPDVADAEGTAAERGTD